MAVIHILLCKYLHGTSATAIREITDAFFALQHQCVKQTTNKPYIISIKGGKDMSIENAAGGWTHAFVVEFASAEDRDYYVKHDAAHHDLSALCDGKMSMEGVIFDFMDGIAL